MQESVDFNLVFKKADLLRRGHLKQIALITCIHPTRVSAIINGDRRVSRSQKEKVAQAILQLLLQQLSEIKAALTT